MCVWKLYSGDIESQYYYIDYEFRYNYNIALKEDSTERLMNVTLFDLYGQAFDFADEQLRDIHDPFKMPRSLFNSSDVFLMAKVLDTSAD